ncbi:MAG: TIGR01777 family protein [Flavobacteriales bacterium]|nr:TIGR01777 family protein [Flavobacteriales bacterium]
MFPKDLAGDVVINLAGAPISKRWTESYRKTIIDSRVDTTNALVDHILKYDSFGMLVNGSATGIYRGGDKIYRENGEEDDSFVADVVRKWEKPLEKLENHSCYVSAVRTGIVLSPNAGFIEKLKPLYKMGLGAPISSKPQWLSWIHEEDEARAILHIATKRLPGRWNLVAPNPILMKEFSKLFAQALHRPHFAPSPPKFMLKLLFGELAEELLKSYRISSQKLTDSGFEFIFPTAENAIQDILK